MPVSLKASARMVVVGLGANLGSPREQLREATKALASLGGGRVRLASLYRSEPIGPEQPDFLNSALALDWPGSLLALLVELQALERIFGRERNLRWGPRVIDLDILWAGERQIGSPPLTVPHLELTRRAFALLPLLDLFPAAIDPGNGVPYATLLAGLHSQRIEKIAGPEWAQETLST